MDDLPGAQLVLVVIAQLVIGEGLKGDTVAILVPAHQHRQTAQLVPGGDDAILGENQDGGGAFDHVLGVADALHQGVLLVDQPGHQLGGVDGAAAHGHELMAPLGEIGLDQLVGVADDANHGDGVKPQVGAHQQGLGVRVADAADAALPVEIRQVVFKLGAEGGIFNVVNLTLETVFTVIHDHTGPAGAQVGVIVRTEENVQYRVAPGYGAEKAAH